jgi:hydroxymethylglutaryl-CoA synthase
MTVHKPYPTVLKPAKPVGIIGYGAYVPRYRLPAREVARIWVGGRTSGLPIKEKAVPGLDEDVVTMSLEAVRNALKRADVNPAEIRAVWIGSESHPYAVKPTSTIVAEAIGATPHVQAADMEFACKAGTEAMVMAMGLVGSGMAHYAVAAGLDTAQGKPGDALEYTAAAGGAAFVIGPAEESLATINASYSFVSDTPDFWRREYQRYPEHGNRFTGEPAYFKHSLSAGKTIMEELGTKPADYNWAIFHQPNTKFPQRTASQLGFTAEQIKPGLLSPVIGNTYAGAAIIGLTSTLDVAKPGDRILMVSFGSGAGSDAFDITVTDKLPERRDKALKTQDYIARRTEIDYATYTRFRGTITMK